MSEGYDVSYYECTWFNGKVRYRCITIRKTIILKPLQQEFIFMKGVYILWHKLLAFNDQNAISIISQRIILPTCVHIFPFEAKPHAGSIKHFSKTYI